ncbi:helix-turn-helix transcriptional regulator [Haloplanus salinarum]|uniref:helix-turn-helix transcriptional regulator n=1 Tax=Haloplanus salinarum TaxID=1912324 RepID=UPI00214AA55F|nr:hypothetical protein [Haloplanus salinarum]
MWERSSGRVITVVAVALLVVAAVPGIGVLASTERSTPPAQMAPGPTFQQGVDTDSVRLIVGVAPNGSATWTVQYWTRLDDENTTAAFESLQEDIRANPANYSDRFASRMRSTVSAAENSTGREMNASGFAVSAETRTPPQYGVVAYTFQWDGFAAVDGDTLRVGDAIEGLFLDERTRLVVEWPAEYTTARVTPEPDERRTNAVVWRGAETSFVSGEPIIVLEPAPETSAAATATPTAAGGDGAGGDGGPSTAAPDGGPGSLPLLGLGLLVALVGGVAWRYRDRLRDGASGPAVDVDAADGSDAVGAAAGAAGAAPESEREDLLSNEERVLQFVREQGGRVKQQEIVEAFDWTEARTSQIVRDLRDDGSLEGFRLGRENVLKLPDEE